jgi:hypothetical protein
MSGPPGMPPTDYRASAELLARKNRRLIEAIKLAYRKHHLGDDSVGSTELTDELGAILADHMGDRAFQAWLKEVSPWRQDD